MTRPSIALVSHELWPFVQGGGIGRSLWAASRLLAARADITIVTTARWQPEYERLVAADDPRMTAGVRLVFVPEPEGDVRPLRSWHHAWSLRLLEGLRAAYPDGGPALVEFNDYWGEGMMAVEARRSGDPLLAHTCVAVRARTSHEITTALNGGLLGAHERNLHGLERCALQGADVLLWPGGDVLGLYQRFYGAEALAPDFRLAEPFEPAEPGPDDRRPPEPGPLRVLYFGRLERRKGVQELVTAARQVDDPALKLTLVGDDTRTGPGGGSMRAHLESLASGDPRIEFHDRVAHHELAAFIRSHHVIVSPSRWESWSNVVREALAINRPVLATPVGGVIEAVRDGRGGWLTAGTGVSDLRRGLEELLERREEIDAVIAAGDPRAALDEMLDPAGIVDGYMELTADPGPPPEDAFTSDTAAANRATADAGQGGVTEPSVTAIVRWRRGRPSLAPTLASLRCQQPPVSVVIVADDDHLPPLSLSPRLQTVVALSDGVAADPLSGAVAALERCDGQTVLIMEVGDVLAAEFVERALSSLARDVRVAYVATLGPDRELISAPLPNAAAPVLGEDLATGPMLIRRHDLEQASRDALRLGRGTLGALVTVLAERGRRGLVIPDRLVERMQPRGAEPMDESVRIARELPPEVWVAPSSARPG